MALREAVVVGEDRAGPDVGALRDRGVTGIRQMGHLGTLADLRVLGLHEPAYLAILVKLGAGAKIREGAYGSAVADDRQQGFGAFDRGLLADLGGLEGRVGADDSAIADRRGAQQLGVGQNAGVPADGDVDVDPRGVRIDDGDAFPHPLLGDAAVELHAETGKLDPVVDALRLPQVVDEVSTDPSARAARDGEHIGQVLLALGVVGGHLLECVAEDVGVESVDPRVDLGDGPLLVRGVLLLDDASHRAVGVAQDATVAGGVVEVCGDDGDGTSSGLMALDQVVKRLGGEEGDVAVSDEDGAGQVLGEGLECTLGGPPGALEVVLVGDDRTLVGRGDILGDELALVADDDRQVLRFGGPCCGHGMAEQREPADLVEDFGGCRLHTGALASGEDDDGSGTGAVHALGLPDCGVHGRRECYPPDACLPAPVTSLPPSGGSAVLGGVCREAGLPHLRL